MNQKRYKCYSAGPDLFPRRLPDGRFEEWSESEARARQQNLAISSIPEFEAITPANTDLASYNESAQARICLLKDVLLASQCDIIFANLTPFGGREPDSGTIVEATTCALNGKLLVLWADPLMTYEERYADADVRPYSPLDDHNNLMIEQLFYKSWEEYFGCRHTTFDSLEAAAQETIQQIRCCGGLHRPKVTLMDRLNQIGYHGNLPAAIEQLLQET